MIPFFVILIIISYVVYYNFKGKIYSNEMYYLGKHYNQKKQSEILDNWIKLEPMDQTNQYLMFLDEAKDSKKKYEN